MTLDGISFMQGNGGSFVQIEGDGSTPTNVRIANCTFSNNSTIGYDQLSGISFRGYLSASGNGSQATALSVTSLGTNSTVSLTHCTFNGAGISGNQSVVSVEMDSGPDDGTWDLQLKQCIFHGHALTNASIITSSASTKIQNCVLSSNSGPQISTSAALSLQQTVFSNASGSTVHVNNVNSTLSTSIEDCIWEHMTQGFEPLLSLNDHRLLSLRNVSFYALAGSGVIMNAPVVTLQDVQFVECLCPDRSSLLTIRSTTTTASGVSVASSVGHGLICIANGTAIFDNSTFVNNVGFGAFGAIIVEDQSSQYADSCAVSSSELTVVAVNGAKILLRNASSTNCTLSCGGVLVDDRPHAGLMHQKVLSIYSEDYCRSRLTIGGSGQQFAVWATGSGFSGESIGVRASIIDHADGSYTAELGPLLDSSYEVHGIQLPWYPLEGAPNTFTIGCQPSSAVWSALPAKPVWVALFAGGICNGKLFVLNGIQTWPGYGKQFINLVQVYHPMTKNWMSFPSTPSIEGLKHSASACIGDIIYVIGGMYESAVSTTHRFNTTSMEWIDDVEPFPMIIASATAIPMGRDIYVFGGQYYYYKSGNVTCYSTVYKFDILQNTWLLVSHLPGNIGKKQIIAARKGNTDAIFLAGGSDESNTPASQAYLFNTTDLTWTDLPAMPYAVDATQGVYFDDCFLIFGGRNSSLHTYTDKTISLCSALNSQWETTRFPSLLTTVGVLGGVLHGKVYVTAYSSGNGVYSDDFNMTQVMSFEPAPQNLGAWDVLLEAECPLNNHVAFCSVFGTLIGLGGASNSNQVWQFGSNETWTRLPDLPTLYESGACTGLGPVIFTIGGTNPSQPSDYKYVFSYRLGDTAWVQDNREPMPTPVTGAAVASLGECIYAFGGNPHGSDPVDACQIYCPVNGTWTLCSRMPRTATGATATFFEGFFFVYGGHHNSLSDYQNAMQRYDPYRDKWTVMQPRPALPAVSAAALVAVGSRLAAIGGHGPNYANSQSVFLYDPATDIVTDAFPQPPVNSSNPQYLHEAGGAFIDVTGGFSKLVVASSQGAPPIALRSVCSKNNCEIWIDPNSTTEQPCGSISKPCTSLAVAAAAAMHGSVFKLLPGLLPCSALSLDDAPALSRIEIVALSPEETIVQCSASSTTGMYLNLTSATSRLIVDGVRFLDCNTSLWVEHAPVGGESHVCNLEVTIRKCNFYRAATAVYMAAFPISVTVQESRIADGRNLFAAHQELQLLQIIDTIIANQQPAESWMAAVLRMRNVTVQNCSGNLVRAGNMSLVHSFFVGNQGSSHAACRLGDGVCTFFIEVFSLHAVNGTFVDGLDAGIQVYGDANFKSCSWFGGDYSHVPALRVISNSSITIITNCRVNGLTGKFTVIDSPVVSMNGFALFNLTAASHHPIVSVVSGNATFGNFTLSECKGYQLMRIYGSAMMQDGTLIANHGLGLLGFVSLAPRSVQYLTDCELPQPSSGAIVSGSASWFQSYVTVANMQPLQTSLAVGGVLMSVSDGDARGPKLNIQALDYCRHNLTTGGSQWLFRGVARHLQTDRVQPITINDNGDGLYSANFDATEAGDYLVSLQTVDGFELDGSPVKVSSSKCSLRVEDFVCFMDSIATLWQPKRAPIGYSASKTMEKSSGCSCKSHNSTFFVLGGWNGTSAISTFQEYWPLLDHWHSLPNIPIPVFDAAAVCSDGIIYLMGGYANSSNIAIDVVQRYNVSAHAWLSSGSPIPRNTAKGAAAMFDGSIYVIGGTNGTVCHTDVAVYQPKQNLWDQSIDNLPCRPVSCEEHTVAQATTDLIYFFGYCTPNSTILYRPSLRNWSVRTSGPFELQAGTSVLVKHDMLLIGTYNNNGSVANYDSESDTWSLLSAQLLENNYGGYAAFIRDEVYFSAGWNSSMTQMLSLVQSATYRGQWRNATASRGRPDFSMGSNICWTNDESSYYMFGGSFNASTALQFNWADRSWTYLPVPPVAIGQSSNGAGMIGDCVYVVTYKPSLLRYNASSQEWDTLPPWPTSRNRQFGRAIGVGDRLYVMGGADKNSKDKASVRCDIYDTVSEEWFTTGNMIHPVRVCPLVEFGGFIYCVGGVTGTTNGGKTSPAPYVQRYDIQSGIWSVVATIPAGCYIQAAASWGDALVALDSNLQQSLLFFPLNGTWSYELAPPPTLPLVVDPFANLIDARGSLSLVLIATQGFSGYAYQEVCSGPLECTLIVDPSGNCSRTNGLEYPCPYSTLTSALEHTLDNATILLLPGPYNETNIEIPTDLHYLRVRGDAASVEIPFFMTLRPAGVCSTIILENLAWRNFEANATLIEVDATDCSANHLLVMSDVELVNNVVHNSFVRVSGSPVSPLCSIAIWMQNVTISENVVLSHTLLRLEGPVNITLVQSTISDNQGILGPVFAQLNHRKASLALCQTVVRANTHRAGSIISVVKGTVNVSQCDVQDNVAVGLGGLVTGGEGQYATLCRPTCNFAGYCHSAGLVGVAYSITLRNNYFVNNTLAAGASLTADYSCLALNSTQNIIIYSMDYCGEELDVGGSAELFLISWKWANRTATIVQPTDQGDGTYAAVAKELHLGPMSITGSTTTGFPLQGSPQHALVKSNLSGKSRLRRLND